MFIIYKATNINNKCYIGLTKHSLEKRKNQHYYKANTKYNHPFYNALNKYIFCWDIIDYAFSLKECELKEEFYIKYYNSNNIKYGYNLSKGGLAGSILSKKGKIERNKKMQKYYNNKDYINKITSHLHQYKIDNPSIFSEAPKKYFSDPKNRILHRQKTLQHNKNRDFRISKCLKRGGKPFYCVETNEKFLLLQDAADRFKTDKRNIHNILKQKRKTIKGFSFKYLGDISG